MALKNEVTTGQLIIAAISTTIVVVGSVSAFWISTVVGISTNKKSIETLNDNYNRIERTMDRMSLKLDEVNKNLTDGQLDIKVALEKKKDKQ